METKSPLGQRKKKSKLPMESSIILGTNFDQQRQLSRELVSPGGSDGEDFVYPLKATWRKSHVSIRG